MVVDIIIQTEINKKENKLYPFRKRLYRPNFSVRPVVGKFYARPDFEDPNLDDPSIEESILKRELASSKEKYKDCVTTNMQYGWYIEPLFTRPRYNFFFPKCSSWITQIGAVIAKEDEKNPKKPFTGVAFKV